MITPALFLVVAAVDPVGDLTDPSEPQVPEDAQMGDGLRLTDRPQPGELEPRAVTCADGETQKGVDISKWQGNVNWNSIAGDGVDFAFVRVSDGLNSLDQKFDKNWTEARAAGVLTGVYQFFRPNQNVLGQADYLLEKMGCNLGARTCPWSDKDLPPVIDVEYRPSGWSKAQMRSAIKTWIERVEEFGVKPIVYSGRYFWRDNVDSTEWSDHPFWIAHYTNNCPNIPTHWSDWAFWQYTESGSVSGVSGNTDVNNFNGPMADLLALRPTGGGAPPVACGLIAAGVETVYDNLNDCFDLHGPNQYWRSEPAGYDGDLNWTKTTAGTEYNYGVWTLEFEAAGRYGLAAYVEPATTEATVAKYAVRHAGGTETVTVDQNDGVWVELGEFDFNDGNAGHSVKLSDKTGKKGQKLVFDALRILPEGVHPEDCGPGHGSPRTDGDDIPSDADRGDGEQGCRVGGSPGAAGWLLLLAGLVFARRRRS